MATTIEQQVALDEALVPSTERLRIGRSNFRLPLDIQSKESTLQVVYDVLRRCPFFKAFLVTADVPEIYMQEFWATAYVHQYSIRYKMDSKKNIVDLEAFREMFHVSPRAPSQSFNELPFEEEILDFLCFRLSQAQILWGLYHKRNIDYAFLIWEDLVYQVEHKNQKKSNEMYYPIPRTPEDSEDDGNGEEDQGLRISEEEKIHEEEEADELYREVDINQGRGLQVSQDIEDSLVTLTLVQPDGQQESSSVSSFVTSMLNPIIDAGVESIFTTASSSVAPLPTPIPTMTPSIITTITTASHPPIPPTPIPSEVLQNLPTFDSVFCFNERLKSLEASFSEYRENDEFLKTIDDNMKRIIKEQVKSQVKDQVSRILPRIKQSVNSQLESKVLTRSSHSSRTSYAVAADLSEMELKKILIKNMEGNKRDDDDDQEGPFTGSDRGSKRRREGGEPESSSTPSEPTTRSASRSTTGTQSRQMSASESAFAEEPYPEWFSYPRNPPTPDRDWNKTLPAIQGSAQTWISELAKHADSRSSFNELLDTLIDFSNFIMNRLRVDTLTPELLAGPTYELMRGSCNSLTKLEYHLEEDYKVTIDQLDWVNLKGQ
nr:hypothetical protein [Tanacetum cinerariifolium]